MAKKKERVAAARSHRDAHGHAQPDPAAPKPHEPETAAKPPPGLDAARHAAAQRAAHPAAVLHATYHPASMAAALGQFDAVVYKDYLDQLIQEAGNPADPVVRLLLRQLAFADLRLSQLQVEASGAK